MSNIQVLRNQYKLAVVGILSLLSAIFIIWQLNRTTSELDRLVSQQEKQHEDLLRVLREDKQ